jgi:hypothetical protein
MSNDQYARLMALDRWRQARNRAHGLYIALQQEERCWGFLPGETARGLAHKLYVACCADLDDIRAELEDAERIWSLTERVAEITEKGEER